MPCHTDEEATIVTVIRRPVVLAVSLRQMSVNAFQSAILRFFSYQEGLDVLLEAIVVKALEGLSVVELGLVRVAGSGVLAEDVKPQLIGPPVTVLKAVVSAHGVLVRVDVVSMQSHLLAATADVGQAHGAFCRSLLFNTAHCECDDAELV